MPACSPWHTAYGKVEQVTHIHEQATRASGIGRLRPALALFAIALGVGAIAPLASGAAIRGGSTRPAAHGVTIAMANESFGTQLVVGSGPLSGFTVYAITSDTTKTFGCTTVVFHGPGGSSFPCTGPMTSNSAEWPALTTTAAPVAGHGVTRALLGTVFRKGIGHQVTYAGHPLYLFDRGPGQITGEGWDEPMLPPWHGQWWVVNPSGSFQEWSQTLTSSILANGSTTALSALMQTGAGFHAFPLYAFSADSPSKSACVAACARVFEPLLTTGTPGLEGSAVTGALGSITRADGTKQVTYKGHPLYLYGHEGIAMVRGRGFVTQGNGNNKVVGGGTFTLVTP